MILPERVLGSSATTRIWRGLAIAPISLATWLRSSVTSLRSPSSLHAAAQDHERDDALAGGRVGGADDRGLGDRRVRDERRLDLGGRDAVAGDVHDVVDPAEQPQVAVVVLLRAVAGEVVALLGEPRPVGLAVALVVAPDAAQHRRPRLGEHQQAAAAVRAPDLPSSSTTSAAMPGSARVAEPGLVGGDAGQRADHDRAGLGLPPGVDDRAAVAADDPAVPHPGLGVDRLADRAEHPQRGQVVLGRDVLAPLHERADRGRRGVEDRHLVLLDDLPEPALVRGVRRALVDHQGGAVRQRPVDDVGVPGDPADVGRAPVDVGVRLEVEDRVVGVGDLGQVAAGGVQDSLRFSGGSRGVEDEQRVLGVEGLAGRARWTGWSTTSCHHTSRPSVQSTSLPPRLTTSTCSTRFVALGQRLVDGRLERRRPCRGGSRRRR